MIWRRGGKVRLSGISAASPSREVVSWGTEAEAGQPRLANSSRTSVVNRRDTVFHKAGTYDAFVEPIIDARARRPLDILAYCLILKHLHLVICHWQTTMAAGSTSIMVLVRRTGSKVSSDLERPTAPLCGLQ